MNDETRSQVPKPPQQITDQETEQKTEQTEPISLSDMSLGKKNCDWCWGRGIAMINNEAAVCKCMRPKTEEYQELQLGRLQNPKIGKHTKGRSKWYGRRGKWQLVPTLLSNKDSQLMNSSPSTSWKFFYTNG